MTTDRALELAEAVLHQERRQPRVLSDATEVDEILREISQMRERLRYARYNG